MLPAIYSSCGSPLHASVAGCVRSPERPPRPRRHPACEPACAPVGDEQGLVARAGVAGAGSEGGRVWASEGPTPAERRTHARTLATPSGLQRSSSDVSLFITRRVPRPPPQRGRLPPPWAQRVMRGIACARKLDRAAGPRWQRCDRAPRWGSSFFYPSSFSCAAKRYREKIVWCGRCFEDVFPPRARDHQPASGGGLAVPATSDRSGERASARGLPQSALAPPASPARGREEGAEVPPGERKSPVCAVLRRPCACADGRQARHTPAVPTQAAAATEHNHAPGPTAGDRSQAARSSLAMGRAAHECGCETGPARSARCGATPGHAASAAASSEARLVLALRVCVRWLCRSPTSPLRPMSTWRDVDVQQSTRAPAVRAYGAMLVLAMVL